MAVLVRQDAVSGLGVRPRAVVLPAVDEGRVGERHAVRVRGVVVAREGHRQHGVQGGGPGVQADENVDQVVRAEVHLRVGGGDDVLDEVAVARFVR